MTSFHEVQLPTNISYGSRGGPKFKTTIFTLASGHEQRNIDWSSAQAEYDISHGLRTLAQASALIAFFRARQGRAYGFRFKDWSDYQVIGQTIGTGDASATAFQISKKYISGSTTYTRKITKIVSSTETVTVAGATTTAYTINNNTGVITFSSAPASAATVAIACCEFDVPVRFDTDHLQINLEEFELQSMPNIPLVEVLDIS